MKSPISFLGFWRLSALSAVCAGAALGVVLLVIAVLITEGSAEVDLEINLDVVTALWSLLLIPLFLLLVFSLLLPLSWSLYRLWVLVSSQAGRPTESD